MPETQNIRNDNAHEQGIRFLSLLNLMTLRKRLIKNCLLELWHDVDENWVVIPEEERQECSDMIEYFIMQISFDNGHCPLDVPFKYEYAIPPGCQSSYTTEQVYCRSQLDEVWRACQRLLSAARCSC